MSVRDFQFKIEIIRHWRAHTLMGCEPQARLKNLRGNRNFQADTPDSLIVKRNP
jgi:hypothetical protein